MINVRQDDIRQEISVSLYGEVQKEVIQATLANDFGLDVSFRETTTICIERPVGTGAAVEVLQSETHPFSATIGLRIEPAAPESGVQFRLDVDPRLIPLFIYKTRDRFVEAMTQYVGRHAARGSVRLAGDRLRRDDDRLRLLRGRRTHEARECHAAHHGGRLSQAHAVGADARARAGQDGGVRTDRACARSRSRRTRVGAVLAAVSRLGGVVGTPSLRGNLSVIEALLPAARAQDLRRQLPGLTGGEGVVETSFGGYQPVRGTPPTRRRTMTNPLGRTRRT